MEDGGEKRPVEAIEVKAKIPADANEDKSGPEPEGDKQISDLFVSFPSLKGIEPEANPLTFRAVLTGIVLGSLVNASNVYLGLKTGFTFGASMFGAIFGYGFILLLTKAFPGVPFVGTRFGPQENSIIQAAATGAGGMAGPFVAGMYRLDLLSDNPRGDFARILTITVICAFFGLFAAVPLRKFFIINVARELNLVFPTPTATALAIRSMHAVGSGAADAIKKIKALGVSFMGALVFIVGSQYADGILHNWHIFTWFYAWGNYQNWALNVENWGWVLQLTPAFFGSGILVGLNAALSWWGTVVAWGLIGPLLVHYGECIGRAIPSEDPKWDGRVTFNSLNDIAKANFVPSPRYWMLWPGVLVLLVYSLVEFLLHFRVIYDGVKYALREVAVSLNAALQARGKRSAFLEKQMARASEESSLIADFASKDQQVPTWVWLTGTVVMVVASCLVCEFQFHMNAGLAILACVLSLIFAFLSIYGGAVTDTAPLTASSKASQLVYGGITHGQPIKDAQRINLIAGNLASGCADVATSLTSDFRVGFLLQTPPKLQFYAQAAGAAVSVFLAPGVFVLFMSAYPCVWKKGMSEAEQANCPFQAPSVVAWQAVAQAVTLPSIPITRSCIIFSIVMGVLAAVQAVVKNFILVGDREKYRNWLPNWMAVGVAWVLGVDSSYANAILFGSITAWWWQKLYGKNFDMYAFSVAAGLIAGEGLAGVVNAALTLGEVDGTVKGTTIGLPGVVIRSKMAAFILHVGS